MIIKIITKMIKIYLIYNYYKINKNKYKIMIINKMSIIK